MAGRSSDNLKVDWRSGGGDRARIARLADELIALKPDILLAIGTPSVEELRQRTTTIPIVFAVVTDPVSQGFVENLAHPGGNITGFTDYDGPLAGKWLEMLTQVTPKVVPRLRRLQSRHRAVRAPDAAHDRGRRRARFT